MKLLLREDTSKYEFGLLELTNDVVFKAFFGDKRNSRLLLDFLESILQEEISSLELLNPYVEPSHSNDKSSQMDLRVLTDKGEQINIEMQLKGHQAFKERMLIYWAKMYGSQDEMSKSYIELNRAVQIVITNFNLLSKINYHSKFQLMDSEDGTIFSSHTEIHVLELPKLKNIKPTGSSKLEQWLLFMNSTKATKEALAMESSIMKEAFDEIQRLSEDPATRAEAISREIHLKDQMQRELDAKVEGKNEGRAEGKIEVILTMYQKRFPIDVIVEATGHSKEDILSIIQSRIE